MSKKSVKASAHVDQLQAQLEDLQIKLAQVQEQEKRALADYQNLLRRTQENRLEMIQMANRNLIEALLAPLEHLELAVAQHSDSGLKMILEQLKRSLTEFGLEEIKAQGKEFDVQTMEVAEGSGQGKKVAKVLRKGYLLNGKVIQHAKVILG
ncbi:MAG: nucleotide exchange factor GrpE [Candidatus Pacebacteria bacterium RIFOXYB1_FULL_39_46]|nr:MAG: nucleotide exchange factor GrpE [Candidatus Pacebacteria bacterium RIFOXYA1_FULL_38_18]OGJ38165.1 MAG: nucleotide exchange factor GrpE [Candidatus Pacebacteria bacterium RIFOXYB1_FULL_39_46]OGJ39613.1 MAG: nucleotide exchange factor GrpE [Candidatus Pacebacteria bacterium RIFOXYC1_FULL_39_21]OGJ39917.1 MAG: nucleotide exchange factor GrpE [Candidatus Pacebacteria bacterium RIFOXYD1_FULL_39_27]